MEYDKSMIHEWSKIREKELYFIREIARLKKLQKYKMVACTQERNDSCIEPRKYISIKAPLILSLHAQLQSITLLIPNLHAQ